MSRPAVTWWPPKVGDTLLHHTLHQVRGKRAERQTRVRVERVTAELHVHAVFTDQDGDQRVVTAEWFPTKRTWHYEIWPIYAAEVGNIWPAPASARKRKVR